MLARKVACPKCQASLKSAKPVPAGVEVTCPRCRTRFVALGDASSEAVAAGPAPGILVTDGSNGEITANPALAPLSLTEASPRPRRELPVEAPLPVSRAPAVILTAFALLLFVAMGGGLAYWCFFAGQA